MTLLDVKALTFDVFGTVVDWRGSIIAEGAIYNRDHGTDVDWAAFADAWRALYQPAMERVRSGERGWIKLDRLHRENLDSLLPKFDLDHLDEAERDHLNRVWHRLDPWPDSVVGMTRLRKCYILAALSNGNVSLIVDMAKHANLPWDVILGAEVAGHYKPDPEAYLAAASLLDLAPRQVMMVAAHNGDLVAARAAGLRTAFVRRPSEYGSGQTNDIEAEHDFDIVAENMEDLASQLGIGA